MLSEELIHLAFAFDEQFLIPSYALLASIFYNNPKARFEFHVIATGLTFPEKEELRTYVEDNHAKIHFYTIDSTLVRDLIVPEGKWYTRAAYYRLFFPHLVAKQVKKLLYLDTDVIVNGSLKEVYETDLGAFPAGAVPETYNIMIRPDLGIVGPGYFNSGVLLIQVDEWKKQQITEKALQFIRKFPEKIIWVDQDALNFVLKNNYKQLDGKYNTIYDDIPKALSKQQCESFAQDKVIIHYTSVNKPWNFLNRNRLRFLYFKYLALSPKAKSKKYFNYKQKPIHLWWFIKLRIKERIYDFPALAKGLQTVHIL